MICNRCGRENPDQARSCQECGHKLQSGRRAGAENGGAGLEPLPLLSPPGPAARRKVRKYLEAWTVAALVWGGACWLLETEWYWPLYPLTVAAAAYAWMRGMTWKD